MKRKTPKQPDGKFVFRAEHFYKLLEKQDYKCALSGRELTPENTSAEHIVPLRRGGLHEFANIYLIDDAVAKLKRYFTEQEVIDLAIQIVAHSEQKLRATKQTRASQS